MQQIMVIEDDRTLNQGLCKALKIDGQRQIVSCLNRKSAEEQLLCTLPSLILLDVNLPDGNGLELLKNIRKQESYVPVILLTANDTDMDIVNGLELGADDYITKPFSLSVLRARVNTQLRKVDLQKESYSVHMEEKRKSDRIFENEKYFFDFEKMCFIVSGDLIELSKTDQKLLRILTANAGNTVRREILLERVWNDGTEFVDANALSVAVKRLRDKINAQDCIRTVYGIGYRWEEK